MANDLLWCMCVNYEDRIRFNTFYFTKRSCSHHVGYWKHIFPYLAICESYIFLNASVNHADISWKIFGGRLWGLNANYGTVYRAPLAKEIPCHRKIVWQRNWYKANQKDYFETFYLKIYTILIYVDVPKNHQQGG